MLRYLMARTELSVLSLVVMTVSALIVALWVADATDPLHNTNVYEGAQIHNALPLVFLSGVAGLVTLGGLRLIGAARGRLLAVVLFLEVIALGIGIGLVITDWRPHLYRVVAVWCVPFVLLLFRAIGAWTGVEQVRFGWWAEWWPTR